VFTLEGEGSSAPGAAAASGASSSGGDTAAKGEKPGGAALARAPRPTAASAADAAAAAPGGITIMHLGPARGSLAGGGGGSGGELLLELRGLCISTPDGSAKLAQNLDLEVGPLPGCWPRA
jgi:hypothetical protein